MMSRRRYWVVGLLGVVSVITFLDRMAIAVVGPLVQQDLKLTPQAWSWVLNAYVLAYGLFEIPSGAWGDKNGQRRELTRISAWWSAFTALTAWCANFGQLFAVRFLFGMGAAGAYPNITGVLGRWLPAAERARGQGVVWGASRLGGALAPAILVPVALAWGWRAVFGGLAVLGLAWAVVWRSWYHDRPAEQPGITAAELEEIGSQHSGALHRAVPWRRLLSLPQLWLLVAAYGFYAWGSWFFYNWFPTWMVRGAHFSNREMGIYASLPFLLGMASNFAGGYLCDRLGLRYGIRTAYRGITFTCLALTSVMLIGMSLATRQLAIVVFATASFAIMDLMLPAAWAMCMAIGGAYGGVASGVMNTSGQAGGFLCTLVFGYIVSSTGNYNIPVQVVAAMVLVAAVLFARVDCTAGLKS